MGVSDIISNALVYPLNNMKALVIFLVLGIIAAIIGGASLFSILKVVTSTGLDELTFGGLSIVGIIVFILVLFMIEGYALDVIKYGIQRRRDCPGIDFGRQISNAAKLVVVHIVYYIIPLIISYVFGIFLRDWILTIVTFLLVIIFALLNFAAKCRLAKSDSLGEALAIGEAIGDISRIGLGKIIATAAVIVVILVVSSFVIGNIYRINGTIGYILFGIFMVYFIFFYNRVMGLLYSDT